MSLWGRNDQAVTANSTTTKETSNGAPIGTYVYARTAGGANAAYGNTSPGSHANVDSAMFNNVTANAFVPGQAIGIFGVSATEMSNNVINRSPERPAHAGWNLRRAGTGPVVSFTVTAAGSGFANGETINVSNGSSNATGTITSNATANMISVSVTSPGAGWTNTGMAVIAFNREKHVNTVSYTGTATGYANTDYILISNGTVNATANVSTNSTGGTLTFTINNVGLFSNTQTNTALVVAAKAANGAASGGSGATFSANLTTSTGGTVTIALGGRAGRVHHETLVAMGSLGAQTAPQAGAAPALVADATSDDPYFPGT
jgi:hypothetical protein